MLIITHHGVKQTFLNNVFLPIYNIFNELSSIRLVLSTSQDIKLSIYFFFTKALLHVPLV